MNTLNRFREIAFGITLFAGLTIAAALMARDGHLPAPRAALEVCAATKGGLCTSFLAERLHVAAPAPGSVAELGEITVVARRDVEQAADLGSLTVTARRYTSVVADLGQITVTAPRESVTVANLGQITVTAQREAVAMANLGQITVTARRDARVLVAQRSIRSRALAR